MAKQRTDRRGQAPQGSTNRTAAACTSQLHYRPGRQGRCFTWPCPGLPPGIQGFAGAESRSKPASLLEATSLLYGVAEGAGGGVGAGVAATVGAGVAGAGAAVAAGAGGVHGGKAS